MDLTGERKSTWLWTVTFHGLGWAEECKLTSTILQSLCDQLPPASATMSSPQGGLSPLPSSCEPTWTFLTFSSFCWVSCPKPWLCGYAWVFLAPKVLPLFPQCTWPGSCVSCCCSGSSHSSELTALILRADFYWPNRSSLWGPSLGSCTKQVQS